MHYAIFALGSRGDVQPFVALGRSLQARGHTVVIAAAEDYGALVQDHGLPFFPLVGRIADIMDREAVYATMDGGLRNPFPLARQLLSTVSPLMDRLFAGCREAACGADALIVSTLGQYAGHSIAQADGGLPVIATHFHPYTPSGHYPHMFFPPLPWLGPLYNRLTHRLGIEAFWHYLRPVLNGSRKRILGLPPLSFGDIRRLLREDTRTGVHLHAYSPTLAPPPPDWDSSRHVVTGAWPLPGPTDWAPPSELSAFLERDTPPVYIGFGSILAGRHPDKVTALLVDALARIGERGVLFSGWGDVGNIPLPPNVFVTSGAYHDWLFPRCRAVVHHGGSGTTGAALRAGIPAVVVPFFGDQRFWGRRLHTLGASPSPIPRASLTAVRLAEGLQAALTVPSFTERTRQISAALRTEDGIAQAIRTIERYTD